MRHADVEGNMALYFASGNGNLSPNSDLDDEVTEHSDKALSDARSSNIHDETYSLDVNVPVSSVPRGVNCLSTNLFSSSFPKSAAGSGGTIGLEC